MNFTKHFKNTFLTTSIATAMMLSSPITFAQANESSAFKAYTDPATGEVKLAPRLLSNMSEAEKALLSKEEKQFLKDVESRAKQGIPEVTK